MRRILAPAAVLAAVLALPVVASGATGTAAPFVKPQYFNTTAPCASCKMFVYTAGTSTKTTTYSNAGLTSANTNPIVLDSAGRADIFLTPGESVKLILTTSGDTDPPTSPIWTVDNVTAIPASNVDVDISATAGEALSSGDLVYLSAGDGGRTAGRWYKTDADLDYASVTANSIGFATAAISSGAAGTVRVTGRMTGLSALSVGSVYYASATAGAITTSAPSLARKIGVADSSTSVIMSHWVPTVDATGVVAGLVSLSAQTLGAGVKTFTDHPVFEPGTSNGTSAPVSGVLNVNVTTVGNVTTGEDDLMSYSIPANTLSSDGKTVVVVSKGVIAASANLKKLRAYYGGTKIFDNATLVNNGDSVARTWTLTCWIARTGAAAELTWCHAVIVGTVTATAATVASNADGHQASGVSTTIDTTAAAIFKVTAEATATDEAQQMYMKVSTEY